MYVLILYIYYILITSVEIFFSIVVFTCSLILYFLLHTRLLDTRILNKHVTNEFES